MSSTGTRTYTLYGVKIYISRQKENTWLISKDWVRAKDIEEKYYTRIIETEEPNGRLVNSGIIELTSLDNVNFTRNGGTYDVEIEETAGIKRILKGVPTNTKKEVLKLSLSKVLRNKKQNPYVIASYAIDKDIFEKAKNKLALEDFLATQGLTRSKDDYQGSVQFSGFINLSEAMVGKVAEWANKKIHHEIHVEEKEEKYRITRLGTPVFAAGALKVMGYISNIDEVGKTIEVTKLTSYDTLRDENLMNIKFFAKEMEVLGEGELKLKFSVKVQSIGKEAIGDDVTFFLSEESVTKIASPIIEIEYLGSGVGASMKEKKIVPKKQIAVMEGVVDSGEFSADELERIKSELETDLPEINIDEEEMPF